MIRKYTVELFIREYCDLGLFPNGQPEPRTIEYFDVAGTTEEIFEWLKKLPSSTPPKEYKRITRDILRKAELLADNDKMFKVGIYHVSLAAEYIFNSFEKI